jgi:glycosyltransferase involved in cell wall biosynthesis
MASEDVARQAAAPLRSVFMVAYHYPPMRSAGVERSAKFVRYLPDFGFAPTVLSTRAFGEADDGVLRPWDPVGAYRRARNPAARSDAAAASRTRTPRPSWLARLRRRALIPDGHVTWLPSAAWSSLRQLRRDPADIIYTSAPPFSAHLLGRFLKAQTGRPWVADFRDAWLYDPLDPALLELPWRQELERRMEEAVVADADLVVAATETTAQDLRRRYPRQAAKIRLITNGFDPDDAMPLPEGLVIDGEARTGPAASRDAQDSEAMSPDTGQRPAPSDRPLRLVHTGSFAYSHPERTPLPLLAALRRLVDLEPIWRERLELVLVGELSPEEQQAAAGIATVVGNVDRPVALDWQRRADVLLLVDHRRPWPASNAPGKLFEYLATRTPLLALCGPGEVQRLVDELGAGVVAPPDDKDAIDDTLRHLWESHVDGTLPRVAAPLEPFHRRHLTGQLAALFEEVLVDKVLTR